MNIFQKTLGPAYEKETGVTVVYELTSVGSLQTRVSTIIETGSGADITGIYLLYPFLFARQADGCQRHRRGDRQDSRAAGTTPRGRPCVVNGKWKAIPFGNIGQLMNWRTDWFEEVGVKTIPGHLGRAARRPARS